MLNLNSLKIKTAFNLIAAAACVFVVVKFFSPTISTALYSIKVFAKLRNFQDVRRTYFLYEPLLEAQKIIPPGSMVTIFPPSSDLVYVASRYILYPTIPTKKEGDYLLDFTGTLDVSGPGFKNSRLVSGGQVFAKSGHSFTKNIGLPEEKYPSDKPLKIFLLFSFLNIVTGGIVLRRFWGGWQGAAASWYLATSYLLGFLILNASVWLFLLAGGRFGSGEVFLVCAAVMLFLLIFLQKQGQTLWDLPRPASFPDISERIFKLLTVLLGLSLFATCILNPVTNWDAMSHWLLKSKIFFHKQELDFSSTHTNYYPVLWSINIAAQYLLMGGVYDEVAQWTAGVFFVILLCQLRWTLTALHVSSKITWLSMFFYLVLSLKFNVLPGGTIQTSTFNVAIPENALLAYFVGSVFFILRWLKDPSQKKFLILAIILAAGMAMVKLEGAVMAAVLGGALFFAIKKDQRSAVSLPLLRYFFYIFLIPLLWSLWIKTHGFFQSFYHLSSPFSFEKVRFMAELTFRNADLSKMFYIGAGIFMFLVLIKRNKAWSDSDVFLAWLSVLLIVFSYGAVLGWSQETIEAYGSEVIKRLSCHAIPSVTLLLASRVS